MDEAEILSDKLVIVHQGSLLASGSVSDLKNKFGGTYVIKLIIPSIFDFSVFTIFKLLNKPTIQSREIVPYKEADPFS